MDKIQLAKNIDFKTAINVSKHKMYSQVSDTNSFKIFVDSILELKKEIGRMESILRYIIKDEKKDLTYPSKVVELFYLSCDSWQVGIETALEAILEMQNN